MKRRRHRQSHDHLPSDAEQVCQRIMELTESGDMQWHAITHLHAGGLGWEVRDNDVWRSSYKGQAVTFASRIGQYLLFESGDDRSPLVLSPSYGAGLQLCELIEAQIRGRIDDGSMKRQVLDAFLVDGEDRAESA